MGKSPAVRFGFSVLCFLFIYLMVICSTNFIYLQNNFPNLINKKKSKQKNAENHKLLGKANLPICPPAAQLGNARRLSVPVVLLHCAERQNQSMDAARDFDRCDCCRWPWFVLYLKRYEFNCIRDHKSE